MLRVKDTMTILIMALHITTLLISEHCSSASPVIHLASFLLTVKNKVILSKISYSVGCNLRAYQNNQ
jgi:hypothetical protein